MEVSDSFAIHYGTIESRRSRKIEKIASDCKTKFSSAANFVRESLGLYIMWWTEPEQLMEDAKTFYPHMTAEQLDYMKKQMRKMTTCLSCDNVFATEDPQTKQPCPKCKSDKLKMPENPDEYFEYEIQKVIDNAGTMQPLPFEPHKGGELRVDIDSGTFRDIQKIISEGDAKKRYPNWNVFFQEAISLFILWWTPGEMAESEVLMYSIWPYMPTKVKEHWENHEKFKETFKGFIIRRNAWCEKNGIAPDALIGVASAESIPETTDKQSGVDVRQVAASAVYEEPAATQQLRAANKAVGAWNLLCQELEDTKSFIDGMQIPLETPADALPSDDYPLIWSFYSRLLPVKVVLTALADMISDTGEDKPVNYRHFREIAYEASLGLAEILKQYETKWKTKRNEKLSTGLPLATFGLDMTDMNKQAKVKASKERFQEHFVGMKEESWIKRQNSTDKKKKDKNDVAFFDGALNTLGLAYFKAEVVKTKSKKKKIDYEIKVGLTRLGADLVGLGNPILENYQREHWKNALADGEIDLILNEIIPRFPLEHSLVNKAVAMLDGVKEKSPDNYLTTKEIDMQFETSIIEWLRKNEGNSYFKFITEIRSDPAKLTPWRVATMGRLGEMRIVDWKLEKGTGKSRFYPHQSLTEKISQLFKKMNN